MKSNFFSKIELLIVIVVFTVIYFIGVSNVTYAFSTDVEEFEYNNKINIIEKQSELYAINNTELFGEGDTIYIYVNDLIENNYIKTDEDGKIKDPLNPGKNLNELKIKIEKNQENYKVSIVTI